MTKNVKVLAGVVVGVAVLAAAYFGAGGGLQGKLELNKPVTKISLTKWVAIAVGDKLQDFSYSGPNCFPNGVFTDIQYGDSFNNYPNVCYLYKKGVFKDEALFNPDAPLTRGEAAQLIWDAYYSIKLASSEAVYNSGPYSDVNDYSVPYFEAISEDASAGILDIKPWVGNRFFPNNYLTNGRAQYWVKNLATALK